MKDDIVIEHLNEFSIQELTKLLITNKFKIIKMEPVIQGILRLYMKIRKLIWIYKLLFFIGSKIELFLINAKWILIVAEKH